MKKKKLIVFFGILALLVLTVIVISLPPIWSRVTYHVSDIYSKVFYLFNPPEEAVFNPGQSTPDDVATAVQLTVNAFTPSAGVQQPTASPTPQPSNTPFPLPELVKLTGVVAQPQMWNNCGPATLSMYLSYWGWTYPKDSGYKSQQEYVASFLKPNERDKNVMPYEMQNFITDQTNLNMVIRLGGDPQMLKTFVNAGIPVMIEKGFEVNDLGWMGHYNLVLGYDEAKQVFYTQDSYFLAELSHENKTADYFEVPYAELESNWRAFDYVMLILYPDEKQNDVTNLLGSLYDETNAFQVAYDRAMQQTTTLTDLRDQYFAWFNAGTSKVKLQDYAGAASAYDSAFALDVQMSQNTAYKDTRPYRMLWYQTGPYYAYFYTGQYQKIIDLATTVLSTTSEHNLEESYHWRGLAELQLGDTQAAIADFREALKYHPDFAPSAEQLTLLGEQP